MHYFQKKAILSAVMVYLIVTLAVIATGCSRDPKGSTTIQSNFSETATSQSEKITPSPVPTVQEDNVCEQTVAQSFLTVIKGQRNTVILGNSQAVEIQGVMESVDYAADGSKAAILFDPNEDGTGRLVFFDGNMDVEVASDVDRFLISNDGSTLAYLTGTFVDGVGCDLYVFDCETGASRLVSENAGRYFALSPKGDAIAFTVFDNPGNADSWVCYVSTDGDTQEAIAKCVYPSALTEDGSLVYAIRLERGENDEIICNRLSVFHESEETILSESLYASSYMNMFFNNDCTQIIYSDTDGICFSHDGEAAILIEPYAKLALTNASCKTEAWSISADLQYIANYSGTNHLYDVLQMIVYEDSDYANLWYFTENNDSFVLAKMWRKTGFVQADRSVLVSDQSSLVYIEDIYSSQNEAEYDGDEEVHFKVTDASNFLLTTSGTIYYFSANQTNAENGGYELNSIQADGSAEAVRICSNCISLDKFEQEGKPDIIYFLAYSEPESVENENLYVSQYYYDLYMIEDVLGSEPVLISENVGGFGVGDYGVYYLQLNEVSPQIIQYYAEGDNNYNEYPNILDEDIYDQNDLFYSSDGKSFDYVTDIARRYLYGG